MPFTVERLDRWVERERPAIGRPDGTRPAGAFVEDELSRGSVVESVATVLLAGRECPWRCVMCDLWKRTTPEAVPAGALVAQLDAALSALPPARHLKLYNAGSFFDRQAVPPDAHEAIASRARGFRSLVLECHPKLVSADVLRFRDRLEETDLEVAMGLETAHPEALARLNKRMAVEDFVRASRFLVANGIWVRTFVLLGTPFLREAEGIDWTRRSIETAFQAGSDVVSVIPVRGGNGAMERLAEAGDFRPPRLESLLDVVRWGIGLRRGRVLADLWDLEHLAAPGGDVAPIRAELLRLNLSQRA